MIFNLSYFFPYYCHSTMFFFIKKFNHFFMESYFYRVILIACAKSHVLFVNLALRKIILFFILFATISYDQLSQDITRIPNFSYFYKNIISFWTSYFGRACDIVRATNPIFSRSRSSIKQNHNIYFFMYKFWLKEN